MPLRPSEHLRKHGLLICIVGGMALVFLDAFIVEARQRGPIFYNLVAVGMMSSLAALLLGGVAIIWNWLDPVKTPVGHICRTCGYDLRASPDRCPECGTPVK